MKLSELSNKNDLKKLWMEYVSKNGYINNTKYLEDIFDRNYKNCDVELYNSANGKTIRVDAHSLLSDIERKYIIVENGVFFLNHNVYTEPKVNTINQLMGARRANKKKRKEAQNNNEPIMALYYNGAQLRNKLKLNTDYGAQLNPYSRIYNYDVGASTTIRGRSTVSMNGISVESIFGSYRPYTVLIYLNFINEVTKKDISKYSKYLNTPTVEEVYNHLLLDRKDNYYASDILLRRLKELDSEDLKKVYYAYNFNKLIDTKYANDLIYDIFAIQNNDYYKIKDMIKEDDPTRFRKYKEIIYLDPLEPSPNVADKVNELVSFLSDMIKGYYWYEGDYRPSGEYLTSTQEIFKSMERERVIVTDTDSLIIYINIMMKYIKESVDKFSDVTNEFDNLMLDYTLGSIVAAVIARVLGEGLERYTLHTLIPEKYRPDISYKQEFFFRTLQVTEGAKNYLGIIGIQEGVFLKNEITEIKGLSLKKANFNKKMSSLAEDIAVNLIAKKDVPNLEEILSTVEKRRKEILDIYKSKDNKEFFTVSKLKVRYGESLGEGESRIKATRLYEALFKDKIEIPGSFIMAKISFAGRVEELEENYNEEYHILDKESIRLTKYKTINSIKNKAEKLLDKEDKKILYNLCKLVEESSSIKDIQQLIREYRKEYPICKELKVAISKYTIEHIDRIALPLDSETIPDFITEFIDSNDLVVFENLASVIVKGVGLEVIRNKRKHQVITNVVSYY